MNVTSRRISTDADTTPTTHSTQQHHHGHSQTAQQHPQHLAYVNCRQAANAASSTHHLHHHSRSSRPEQQEDEDDQDQEQIVTSTSTDCLLPLQAEGEGEEVAIDLDGIVVTSPARITSSTNNYDILTCSSADSLSLEEEMVMPSTSENAARLEREKSPSSYRGHSRSTASNDMVARDIALASAADGSGNSSLRDQAASTSSSNAENHSKIILKLPKTVAASLESQSGSEDDQRKVEPLKINLHNHLNSSHHTPKITIKILKEPTTDSSLVSSEECSSSAEDDIVAKVNHIEPHIVPKLTIRAKNEDYDSSLTSVVPKLTIKINDSAAASDSYGTATAAASTPPLPKLTIKTGQDGQAESIITNLSPASSTTSSSSSVASSSASCNSSNNVVPKLTIKPLQKSQDFGAEQLPLIPKLCIKTNTLSTDGSTEEASASKIPKLTIKTGQEHAVIITQHNDNAKNSGGIPKLTIKTKSLDVAEDCNAGDKTMRGSEKSCESIPKLCINKAQLEAAASSMNLPKQPSVPKLTISRQTAEGDGVLHQVNSIPKMTIKTQSNKAECVTKLTRKSVVKPAGESFGEGGDLEEPELEKVELNKTIPKLTIKNVGSPKQKLKIVMDTKGAEVPSSKPPQTVTSKRTPCNEVEASNHANNEGSEFNDLLPADNGGEESSNSQEFCGFNEALTAADKELIVVTNITTEAEDAEFRRQSEDMDIDESLHGQHEPQIFQNASHFDVQSLQLTYDSASDLNGKAAFDAFPKKGFIIDTVDLTSSPGSSPARRFDYEIDDDILGKAPQEYGDPEADAVEDAHADVDADDNTNVQLTSGNILLERLQRDNSVKQKSLHPEKGATASPPPLQPKPPHESNVSATVTKYPELVERLMANGTVGPNVYADESNAQNASLNKTASNTTEHIIDSIEILDTPEGSPRNSLDERPEAVKQMTEKIPPPNGIHYPKDIAALDATNLNNNNSNLKRHAPSPLLSKALNDHSSLENNEAGLEEVPPKMRKLQNASNDTAMVEQLNTSDLTLTAAHSFEGLVASKPSMAPTTNHHPRARKQKHEHLLPLPSDEILADAVETNSNDSLQQPANEVPAISTPPVPPVKRKGGRPRRSDVNAKEDVTTNSTTSAPDKSRRVQLLRKRLAIDMVDGEQPLAVIDELSEAAGVTGDSSKNENDATPTMETPKRERNLRTPLRTSRRSNTPTTTQLEAKSAAKQNKGAAEANKKAGRPPKGLSENILNNFVESNSLISSITSALEMATQIDLTMSSSSSSNGSTTNTVTTVEAVSLTKQVMAAAAAAAVSGSNGTSGGVACSSNNNSMLPPATILSSSDPLPDVLFQPNDFSSILAAHNVVSATAKASSSATTDDNKTSGFSESQDEDMGDDVSGADCSEDDSASSSSISTPGRGGRTRGRGSRGGRSNSGRAYRPHRLGRGASAAAKAIAVQRPRWSGTLNHTPDPERIKALYSPSPQVFEEDTRMSADLTQTTTTLQQYPLATPTRQPDFLNNEESQSSVISNNSILDPNNVLAIQNGSAIKKTARRKKMEVCVAEDAEITVSSIAEYEWPRPKGCCPSKNRDTFMIQEQVAMYLGIKSFKRKYPDLPRRQVDMEERSWLQEQGLVSEKMCDLGITAVWASDILDIMYADFYEKYEEYKDYVRQKHLREIEAKQKSLGLNVAGRGLQARDRALLNASKWNTYFNRTRREERSSCLDLQTLVVNKPSPATAPLATLPNRPVAEAVSLALAKTENIPTPPTLLAPRICEPLRPRDVYYPLSLVPGQFCEKYTAYTMKELRRFPLNTVLDHPRHLWQRSDDEANSSETDSAVESIENDAADAANTSSTCQPKMQRKRRLRRLRTKNSTSNEEFKIPPLPGTAASTASSTDNSSSSSDDTNSETDSDSSSSASSEESSEDESSPATCSVCRRPQNRNLKSMPELFVKCYTCRRKVHPSCIDMPQRMANRIRNYNWQCTDCKCCIKCKRKQDQNKMLFCEQCDRGYHIYCSKTKEVPDDRWSCERCSFCMRCGSTKPEGLPMYQHQLPLSPSGSRPRQWKWVHEYRMDAETQRKQHCSMLCVPCARDKALKQLQITSHPSSRTDIFDAPKMSSLLNVIEPPTAAATTVETATSSNASSTASSPSPTPVLAASSCSSNSSTSGSNPQSPAPTPATTLPPAASESAPATQAKAAVAPPPVVA